MTAEGAAAIQEAIQPLLDIAHAARALVDSAHGAIGGTAEIDPEHMEALDAALSRARF